MSITLHNKKIDALINLLEDEDRQVSTAAMEQILRMEEKAEPILAELQESHNPILRNKIHQLGTIIKLRRLRSEFVNKAKGASLTIWEGVVQLNIQYNPKANQVEMEHEMGTLMKKFPNDLTIATLAHTMRGENFSFTKEDILGADLYLVEDVLAQRTGSPIILSVIARELAKRRNLDLSIVIYKGRHCLVDSSRNLLDVSENWMLRSLSFEKRLHSCQKKDIWLTVLCQLFISSISEGRLQSIHRVGSILAELCGGNFRNLPFPLGKKEF